MFFCPWHSLTGLPLYRPLRSSLRLFQCAYPGPYRSDWLDSRDAFRELSRSWTVGTPENIFGQRLRLIHGPEPAKDGQTTGKAKNQSSPYKVSASGRYPKGFLNRRFKRVFAFFCRGTKEGAGRPGLRKPRAREQPRSRAAARQWNAISFYSMDFSDSAMSILFNLGRIPVEITTVNSSVIAKESP